MKKVTIIGIALAILILLGVEVYALMTPETGDTISEISWAALKAYPMLGVISGMIIGHISWPLTATIRDKIKK